MSIRSVHPLYTKFSEDWEVLRDSYEGERAIKEKTTKYLPPTPGQVLDGMPYGTAQGSTGSVGYVSYMNYLLRAIYPDFFAEGVRTLVGILNERPPKVTVPKDMEYILKRATPTGETIFTLLREVHREVLITGRLGLLADMDKMPDQLNPEHYIEMYKAEKILNWDDGGFNDGLDRLNLVVLDETGYKRTDDFNWNTQEKFRVLVSGGLSEDSPLGEYRVAETESGNDDFGNLQFSTPVFKGEPSMKIPFVFIGTNDLNSMPSNPPLLGLARICLAIYRGEADYRYTLFMQAQETLVIVGGIKNAEMKDGSEPVRVGAGARIDVETGGDAKYIGIRSSGLSEQRESLKADRELAAVRTGQLLAPGKMSMESGEALKTRVAAQTATLTSIAVSAAAGLQDVLQKIAVWRGLNPEEVIVEPNLDFTNYQFAAQDLVQAITAKKLGFPIAFETLHQMAKDRGLTRNTFVEEVDLIKNDPKELTEAMYMEQTLTGNNPTNAAGGPKANTQERKPQTNEQK